MQQSDIDLFELHDAFSIVVPMSLEVAGFAARGHPVGASGVYPIIEAAIQLRGEAGANQVPNAQIAMAQSLGGVGTTAVSHILIKD